MKYLIFLGILFSLSSCKDVDKNPSGCGYDYVQDEGGKCMSKDYITKRSIEKNNVNYHNSLFLKQIVTYDTERLSYSLLREEIEAKVNSGLMLDNYNHLATQVDSILINLEEDLSQFEEGHDNSDESYREIEKLRSLRDALESVSNAINDLAVIYTEYKVEGDYSNKTKLIAKINKLLEQDPENNKISIEFINADTNYGSAFEVQLVLSQDGGISNLYDFIKKQIEEDQSCTTSVEDCISQFKEDVWRELPHLYNAFFHNM